MAQQIKDVFTQNQYDLKKASIRSKAWFQQQALLLGRQNITARKVMNSASTKVKGQVVPGSLYMFMYDPKMKDELPYYDKFPLVFPYKKVPGGFMGLNMHYLPYQARIVLLQRLMDFATDTTLTENTRLKLSWRLIGGISKFKSAEACVKHYLNSHVMSTFRKIDAPDWTTAMLLPVEQFVGANKAAVWKDSLGY
jgi:hypothetical protein